MLERGPARKITVYVGEDVRHHGEPLYLAVLNYLFQHRVSGAMITKGVAGFGADHHLHTSRILEVSENLPIKIEFIESAGKAEQLLPKLLDMVGEGVVEAQDTTILKSATARPRS
jgi:PII-like signaling protein